MTGQREAAAGDAHAVTDGEVDAPSAVDTLELGGGIDRSPSWQRRRRRALTCAGSVGLVLLLGASTHAYVDDRLPRHAIIAGVDVGGLDREVAEQRLRSELGPRSVEAMPVTIGSAKVQVMPSTAGLTVDFAASIDGAGPGAGWGPREVLRILTSGTTTPAAVTVDQTGLTQFVTTLAEAHDSDPTEPQIELSGTTPRVVPGRDGVHLLRGAAARQIQSAYLSTSDPITLATTASSPRTAPSVTARFLATGAVPALSADVTVAVAGHGSFVITRQQLAKMLLFANFGNDYAVFIDGEALRAWLEPELAQLNLRPQNNAVRYFDDRCILKKAQVGQRIDAKRLATALEDAVLKSGKDRRATAVVVNQRFTAPDPATQERCR